MRRTMSSRWKVFLIFIAVATLALTALAARYQRGPSRSVFGDMSTRSVELYGPAPAICLKGDLRCDQTVCDLFDVLDTIDQVLNLEPETCEGDVTCNGDVDLFDVTCQINCALGKPDHCLINPCSGGPLAAECDCRNLFFAGEFVEAHDCFDSVLAADPGNEEALFFRSITRLIRVGVVLEDGPLPGTFTDSLKEMLEQVGIDTTGLDPLKDGFPPFPDPLNADTPTSGDTQEFVQTVFIPELEQTIIDLSLIGPLFNLVITQQELASFGIDASAPIEVDFADSKLLESFMRAWRGALSTIFLPYDIDIDIDEFALIDVINAQVDLLDAHPDLLTLLPDGANTLALARQFFLESIAAYLAASNFIRNLDDVNQNDDLVTIDPVDLADEEILRTRMGEVWCSLSGVPLDFIDDSGASCHPSGTPVVNLKPLNLAAYYLTPFDLRSVLPPIEFDATCGKNYVDVSSPTANSPFPDPTFNGVLPGKTQAELLMDFPGIGEACPQLALAAGFIPDDPVPDPSVTMAQGQILDDLVTIDVNVTNTENVYGASFDVSFDPSLASFVAFGTGVLLEMSNDPVLYLVSETSPGLLEVAVTLQGPLAGVDAVGTIPLIRLTFQVLQEGSSPVEFVNQNLLDDQAPPQPIPGVSWAGGLLTATLAACDCCQGSIVLGCNCPSCEQMICSIDAFCCSVEWDSICAAEASSFCDCCPGQSPGACGG